jgi:tRNA(fMet)-specific endonuclease VapC
VSESTPVTGRVVPDSNAVVALLAGDASVAARLNAATEVLLAAAVLGELRYGALNSGRVEENLTRLDQFSSICRFAPVTEAVVHAYAELRVALKKQGRPVPENDIWIAATAKALDAVVITADAHFANFPGLAVESPR